MISVSLFSNIIPSEHRVYGHILIDFLNTIIFSPSLQFLYMMHFLHFKFMDEEIVIQKIFLNNRIVFLYFLQPNSWKYKTSEVFFK